MGESKNHRLDRVVRICGILAVIVGVTWLTLWLTGVAGRWSAAGVLTMKTNMAFCLTLGGLSLLLLSGTASPLRRWAAALPAAVVFLIGALTLSEHLFGYNLGIDQLLATEVPGAMATAAPNRIGPPGSSSLVLLGLGLLALATNRRKGVAYLGLAVCLINMMPLVGFLYGITDFYSQPRLTGIAWPTVLAFLALGSGLILAVRDVGPMVLLLRADQGGAMLRRLLPAVILIPLVLGFVMIEAERAGLLESTGRLGMLIIALIVVFSYVVWYNAMHLSRAATEHDAVEEALRKERSFAQLSLDIVGVIVVTIDSSARVTMINRKGAELLGYPQDEIVGKNWLSTFIPTDIRMAIIESFRSLMAGAIAPVEYYENPVLTRNGEERLIAWHNAVLRDEEGHIIGTLSAGEDITEKRLAEEELRESEERFRTLFSSMNEGFALCEMIFDDEGKPCDWRYLELNRAWEDQTGLTASGVVGKRVRDVLPNIESYWIEEYGKVVLTGRPARLENYVRDIDRYIQVSAYRTAPGQFAAIFLDVTDRKRTEQERERLLEEVERRAAELTATFDAIADGVAIYAPDGTLTYMNAMAEHLFKYAPDEHALPVEERVRAVQVTGPDGSPLPYEATPSFRALQGETVRGEVIVLHRQDRGYWLSVSAAPICLPDGTGIGSVLSFTDITPLHVLQERERRYLYTLAHNLNVPAALIKGNLELLLEVLEPAECTQPYRHLLAALRSGLQRMNSMIEDFSLVTRLEEESIEPHAEPVELASYLPELLQRSEDRLDTGRIHVDIPPDLPPAQADPRLLETILLNLLHNAVKFSEPETPIRVGARRQDGEIIVSVADRGIGIPPDDLPHLFDRFYRAAPIRRAEGTGLGLYIVKRLVEAHGLPAEAGTAKVGGRVWVESEEGKGSTFLFTLPAAGGKG